MKHISLLFSTVSFVGGAIASSALSFNTLPVLAQTAGCGSGWSNTAAQVLTPIALTD